MKHKDTFIFMPALQEAKEIAQRFEMQHGYPQCMGAVDGTHIPVLPPSDATETLLIGKCGHLTLYKLCAMTDT